MGHPGGGLPVRVQHDHADPAGLAPPRRPRAPTPRTATSPRHRPRGPPTARRGDEREHRRTSAPGSGSSPTRSTGPHPPTTRWSPSPPATTSSCARGRGPRRAAAAPASPVTAPLSVLDLGCGSGASTRALLDAWAARGGPRPASPSPGVDASEGMVAQARAKSWPPASSSSSRMPWRTSSRCPTRRSTASSPRYLLRNVPDRERLVREVARVLRPGGAVVIHDYSVAGSTRARVIWAAICHGVIIPLAVVKRSDVPLHRYLYTSVRDFDSVARICDRLLGAGLVDVRHRVVCRVAARRRAHRRRVVTVVIPGAPRAAMASGSGPPGGLPPATGSGRPRCRMPCRPASRHVVVVGGGIAGPHRRAGAGRARRPGHGGRARAERLGGRVRSWPVDVPDGERGADEPGLPRLLPAVLQPARRAAPHRPHARAAAPAGRLPPGARRRRRATRSRGSRAPRRGTSPPSSPAAPASTSPGWPRSTSRRRWACSTSTSPRRTPRSTG